MERTSPLVTSWKGKSTSSLFHTRFWKIPTQTRNKMGIWESCEHVFFFASDFAVPSLNCWTALPLVYPRRSLPCKKHLHHPTCLPGLKGIQRTNRSLPNCIQCPYQWGFCVHLHQDNMLVLKACFRFSMRRQNSKIHINPLRPQIHKKSCRVLLPVSPQWCHIPWKCKISNCCLHNDT